MVYRTQTDDVLEAVVTGIPRVAESIARISTDHRERAFQAVERSYRQTARELGYSETDAEGWISAIMFRLRSQVTQLNRTRGDIT
jgi:hypothetical protein